MTPCIQQAKKANIHFTIHEYTHDASAQSYGTEAAEKLGVTEEQVFKTLVVEAAGKGLIVAIIPVSSTLNMKLMAKASGSKKVKMAEANHVERSTGYVLGGVSPMGQKKKLATFIDSSAQKHTTIFVSAGRRGLEIELAPNDLKKQCHGVFSDICS